MAVIGGEAADARGTVQVTAHETIERYGELRRELIGVERATILGLRNEGRLRQETMRAIQRDLDLEEARLPA
jgi:CPA1 family monovalent cation:H+ antiporter